MDKHRSYWRDLDAGQRQYIANLAEIKDSLRFMQDSRIGVGFREGAQAYVQSIGTMREATAQLAQTGIKGVEDAIFSLVTTGTANFRDFAASILKDTARMIIQQLILRSVMQIIGAIGGGGAASTVDPLSNFNAGVAQYAPLANAMGNAFASNGIVPFAMGGVVTRPTMFAFANGGVGRLGLMGEAGPEAIMPLRRLPSGKLGVGSTGGGAVTVNVSVDATGSQVQGDGGQGAALGRAVASAVQAELIKQRRPGGILAA
jgi:lambda family phage tail tape measure protein